MSGSLRGALERAKSVFPSLAVDPDAFRDYLDAHPAREEALAREDADGIAEIFLVLALKNRAPGADREFEARYLAPIGAHPGASASRRLGARRSETTRSRKALGRSCASKSTRGADASRVWCRSWRPAKRSRYYRKTRREAPLDDRDLADPIAERWDPGLEMLKGRARDAFRDAFEASGQATRAAGTQSASTPPAGWRHAGRARQAVLRAPRHGRALARRRARAGSVRKREARSEPPSASRATSSRA